MTHNPGFLKLVNETRSRVHECMIDDVKAKLDRHQELHLIDVREDHEYVKDHIMGAHHLGKGILEHDIETLIPDRQAEIVLYCGGGFRSVLAADSLQRMGYTKVTSMDGGIRAWREAGYPLETGAGTR